MSHVTDVEAQIEDLLTGVKPPLRLLLDAQGVWAKLREEALEADYRDQGLCSARAPHAGQLSYSKPTYVCLKCGREYIKDPVIPGRLLALPKEVSRVS